MKTPNLKNRVMGRVVTYESQRSARFLRLFGLLFLLLVIMVAIIGIWIAKNVYDFQTLDALSIFGQDKEIIVDYWQDTLFVLVSELPWDLLLYGALVFLGALGFVLVTRRRRQIMQKRLRQVANYPKK